MSLHIAPFSLDNHKTQQKKIKLLFFDDDLVFVWQFKF